MTALPVADASDTPLGRFWQEYRRPLALPQLIALGGVGAAGGLLLVGHRPGLGAALVGAAVWAPAVPALVRRGARSDLALAALSIALLAVVAVRDAGWLVLLCAAVAALTGAVAATSSRSTAGLLLTVPTWFGALVRSMPWVARTVAYSAGRPSRQTLVALRSAGVTVALLVVFGLLFASADRVFASYLPRLTLDRLPGQVVVGVLVALVTATLAHLAVAPPAWGDLRGAPGRPARRGEWMLPVVALDVLVLAFVLVQVGALVGGHAYVEATAGLGYAQYAREGFAQLVAATALTLVVVGVAVRHAPRESAWDRRLVRLALGVLCLGTLGVVASALRRMDLYVEAFGLTRLRLFVVVVEVVLAVVLLLVMVAGLRPGERRGAWLPRAVLGVVGAAVLGLAAVNPDAVILRHNVQADLEVPLDVWYLQGLSADALPDAARLEEPLRSCVLADMSAIAPDDLAGWNAGRDAARTALETGDSVRATSWETCLDSGRW